MLDPDTPSPAAPEAEGWMDDQRVVTREQLALAHDITFSRLRQRVDAPVPLAAFLADLDDVLSRARSAS